MKTLDQFSPAALLICLSAFLLAVPFALVALIGLDAHDSLATKKGYLDHLLVSHARDLDSATRSTLTASLLEAERETGIDALLLFAVIERESRFDVRARSDAGALGLMQVRPVTARSVADRRGWRWRGAEQLYDPRFNVRVGSAYLAQLQARFEHWSLALAAYHAGPSRLRRRLARGGRAPSTWYANQVLERYAALVETFEAHTDRELAGAVRLSAATTRDRG